MKFYNNIDLLKNEIQNFRVQNLAAAPSNPVVGQHYFNTVDNTEYVYDGTKWIDALSQGDYTFMGGVKEEGRNVFLMAATKDSIGGVIIGSNIDVENGTISVKDASTTDKGLIEIATDEEAEAGSDTTRAINAKQLNTKVTKNADITAGTKTKITYDAKGLVTGGADLSEADIPSLHLAKITDVTATATEVNVLDGIEVTTVELNTLASISGNVQEQLDSKVAKNDAITAGTKTKITYDAKGLVTGGADLSEADIPSIHLAKISDVTATATEVNVLDGITATTAELNILDGVTADKDEINILDGATITTTELNALASISGNVQEQLDDKVAKNADITAATKTKITYDAKGLVTAGADLSEADIPALHLTKITDVSATASEVNQLAGAGAVKADFEKLHSITVTASQINAIAEVDADDLAKLADITASAEELNILDGATLSTEELNILDGVTATTAEINVLDGITATTAQLNRAADLDEVTKADLTKLHSITVSASEINNLPNKIELTDLSATGPITYDNTTGVISATYDNAPTNDSNNLVKSGAIKDALDDKLDVSLKGAANGLAELDANGLVPSTQLPSYVDDVIDLVAISATAPATASNGDKYYNTGDKKIYTYSGSWGNAADPETGKIYVANEMAYRWSGTAMVQIGADKLKGFEGTIEGDGTTTTFTINHNLGTRNVVCEIYDATTYEKVYVNLIHSTASAVQAIFSQAPAVGDDFIITIIAIG